MALDTSGNWVAGDDLRVIEALHLGFSQYMLEGIQVCMNDLERISGDAVVRVRTALVRYEAARAAKIAADLGNTEDKMLTKADVLEWSRSMGGGVSVEMGAASEQVRSYFSSCPYVPQRQFGTALIRS
jgi:hypothetical protein